MAFYVKNLVGRVHGSHIFISGIFIRIPRWFTMSVEMQ